MAFNSETAKKARAKASGRGESKIKKWIKAAADKQDTIAVFKKLTKMAKDGDMDAIKTYMAYVVGKPKDTVEITGDPESPVIFKIDGRFKEPAANNS